MLVGSVSMNRVMNFLHLDDHEATENDFDNTPTNIAVSIQNGSFRWNKSIESLSDARIESLDHDFSLENINF